MHGGLVAYVRGDDTDDVDTLVAGTVNWFGRLFGIKALYELSEQVARGVVDLMSDLIGDEAPQGSPSPPDPPAPITPDGGPVGRSQYQPERVEPRGRERRAIAVPIMARCSRYTGNTAPRCRRRGVRRTLNALEDDRRCRPCRSPPCGRR